MGIYYTTYFYPDIHDKSKFRILAQINPIIDNSDKQRGYVAKDELLQYYGDLIQPNDITEKSFLVEYMISTMTVGEPHLHETQRFPVV